ncbi:MAG TPA: MAPEG family protein [Rubrobacteraceae bacterium]|nr:MAPEG family protein [Rubrobacteraceae bacterium]
MTVELKMLTLSVVLGIVQIVAASHAASLQRGYQWTASSRDEKVPPLQGVAGRLDRALRNFLETFPLFAAVVLAAHVTDTHNALTALGAQLYFWARLAYALLYAAGVPVVRSLVWNVATVGILLLVAALFLM